MANVPQAKLKFYKGYGENFKKLREMKGLTQKQLYDKTHISDKSISLIEKEKREPTIEQINIYSEYFGASLDYLTGRTAITNPTVQMISEYTGISENAISSLKALTTSEKGVSEVIEAILKNKYFEEAILDIIHLLTYPTDKPENYFEFEGHSIETKKFLRSSVNDELSSLGHNLLTDEKLKGVQNNG